MTILLSPVAYTVRRYERSVVNGVIETTEVERFEIVGSMQPWRGIGDELLTQFPEGFRTSAKFKLYTDPMTKLRIGGRDQVTGEEFEPDRVEFEGRLLYVHGLEEYAMSNGLIPHRKWVLAMAETSVGAFTEEC